MNVNDINAKLISTAPWNILVDIMRTLDYSRCVECRLSSNKGNLDCGNFFELVKHRRQEHGDDIQKYVQIFQPRIRTSLKRSLSGINRVDRNPPKEESVVQIQDNYILELDRPFVLVDDSLRTFRRRTAVEDLAFIPGPIPGYVWNETYRRKLIMAGRKRKIVYIWGETGTGKTSMIKQYCYETHRPRIRMNMRGDITSDIFVGRRGLRDGETYWIDGLLIIAMERGYVLNIDEPDYAPSEIMARLNSVLDSGKLVLDEDDGRVVTADPDFQVIFSGNTPGLIDMTTVYSGTQPINAAIRNRVQCWIEMEEPTTEWMISVLDNNFQSVPHTLKDFISRVVIHINAAFRSGLGSINSPASLRDAQEFCQMIEEGFTPREALHMAIVDAINDTEEKKAIWEFIDIALKG